MKTIGVILARAGSKGLPRKCMAPLLDKPIIDYTLDHALSCDSLDQIIFSTDCIEAAERATQRGISVIERPNELATDTARVDDAARHAVLETETNSGSRFGVIALIYGNIPIRAPGITDRVVAKLIESGADSVRTVSPAGRHHPDWSHRLVGRNKDVMLPFRPNGIWRRQDLEPLYFHDGAAVAVKRNAFFSALEYPDNGQAFLGAERRAIIQESSETVDVDEALDLCVAEAILKFRQQPTPAQHDGPAATSTNLP